MGDVSWARDLARRLLAEPLPRRWAHTQGVGRKAESIAHVLGDDAEDLVCAAWLHDIGYAPDLVETGFHPLDGARYMRDVENADARLCRLIANHSCAHIEAARWKLDDELTAEFPTSEDLLFDAMTYCDMTTSPDGDPVSASDRLDEILSRYGGAHIVTQAMQSARPRILHAERRLKSVLAAASRGLPAL